MNMSRFSNPLHEPESDADIDRRLDERKDSAWERVSEQRQNCLHIKIVDGVCRHCGEITNQTEK